MAGALALVLALGGPVAAQQTEVDALLEQATAGAVEAQRALALAYHAGSGVAQNYAQAALWAEQAAALWGAAALMWVWRAAI